MFANSYLELILCRLLSPFSFSSTSIKLNVFGLMYDGKTYKLHTIVIHLQCQNECCKRFQMIEIRLLLFWNVMSRFTSRILCYWNNELRCFSLTSRLQSNHKLLVFMSQKLKFNWIIHWLISIHIKSLSLL